VIRAVIDANAIVSGTVRFREGTRPPALILQAWTLGRFALVMSDPLLQEVIRTLSKPYFRANVEPGVHTALLAALQRDAIQIAITTPVTGVATHPEDDVILGTALSGAVEYLVTGDKQLQRAGQYQGIAIVSPSDFLDVLNQPEGDGR
jgi:uncharacterized protein